MGKPVGFGGEYGFDLVDADGNLVCSHGTPDDKACNRCERASCGWDDGGSCSCETVVVSELYKRHYK